MGESRCGPTLGRAAKLHRLRRLRQLQAIVVRTGGMPSGASDMSLRVFEAANVRFPVLCVAQGFWWPCADSAKLEKLGRYLWNQAASGSSCLPGVLVTSDAQVHRLVQVRAPADERMFRSVEPEPLLKPILECDGDPFIGSVQQVHGWVAIASSAAGHFESSSGFGLPSDLGSATSVSDLLARLVRSRGRLNP